MFLSALKTRSVSPVVAACVGSAAIVAYAASQLYRHRRGRWRNVEEQTYGHEALHSIISHFASLQLDPSTTVEEANKRRTASYYQKARDAHRNNLVEGISSMTRLIEMRRKEVEKTLSFWNEGNKSHRTVLVMCDASTRQFLSEARAMILRPLRHSADIYTPGVWIPELNLIPEEDMHVTVAIPWWWHTMGEGNSELTRELASRFHQTLLLKFHHPFFIELERIVLLGGKTLVALWRCVGERETEDGIIVYDRHGSGVDPFVMLREEIVRCFTTESPDFRRKPLTYVHKKESCTNEEKNGKNVISPLPKPPRPGLKRQNTIEAKTPGVGQGDGFIHTTLCRLPLESLSQHDVELDKIHRLCREASATLCGHRMAVSKFRFLETTGCGGESNPCVEPIFDETIEAPTRAKVDIDGKVEAEPTNLHVPTTVEASQTIGAVRNFSRPGSVVGLFEPSQPAEGGDPVPLKVDETIKGEG